MIGPPFRAMYLIGRPIIAFHWKALQYERTDCAETVTMKKTICNTTASVEGALSYLPDVHDGVVCDIIRVKRFIFFSKLSNMR